MDFNSLVDPRSPSRGNLIRGVKQTPYTPMPNGNVAAPNIDGSGGMLEIMVPHARPLPAIDNPNTTTPKPQQVVGDNPVAIYLRKLLGFQ